jgi:hypothetical protein
VEVNRREIATIITSMFTQDYTIGHKTGADLETWIKKEVS